MHVVQLRLDCQKLLRLRFRHAQAPEDDGRVALGIEEPLALHVHRRKLSRVCQAVSGHPPWRSRASARVEIAGFSRCLRLARQFIVRRLGAID